MSNNRKRVLRPLVVAAIAGSVILCAGCTVNTRTTPPVRRSEVVYVEEVPAEPVAVVPERIERYPHTTFRGGVAYEVEGRWYTRLRSGAWVVLREEPPELRTYRSRRYIESSVPPAPPVVVAPPRPVVQIVVIGSVQAERVESPPRGWERGERGWYDGGAAFYVSGRWYVRHPHHGWVALREEPRELARHRHGRGR